MKKSIPVALALLTCGLATNAQISNNKMALNKPDVKSGAILTYELDKQQHLKAKNDFLKINNSIPGDDKIDYRTKSRNQKTAAWILLGGGVVGIATGLVVEINNAVDNTYAVFADESPNNTGIAIAVMGGCMAIGSIPLFAASSRNKKKAMLSISELPVGPGAPANVGKYITGVSLSIPLGK